MSIFGWAKQNRENLKKLIIQKEEFITQLLDDKITAEINLERVNSSAAAIREDDRAYHEVEVAKLKREIKNIEADTQEAINSGIRDYTDNSDAELSAAKISHKKELRAEFQSDLDIARKAAKSATEDANKSYGLYSGALLVIKALEKQLDTANKLNTTLVNSLPEVKANLNGGNQSVTVNK